ncbi:predicted protein [Uncinocarpus reesii 1704]|uniref:Uncharacterized protein n=1 Tax=Uncinocarpus reesii (strain UAMH 1704) TaxID=336963 RepID=C4JLM1_UNCRE|nr:uncharacterized protein UREG_03729 [Uncinocarpus reesii 1704]EEP78883.1 predicted protein [Uncinocarpus reesii 1704]
MVIIDDDFLTPRDLLIDEEFCVRVENINIILQFIQISRSIPKNSEDLIKECFVTPILQFLHLQGVCKAIIPSRDNNLSQQIADTLSNVVNQFLVAVLERLSDRCRRMVEMAEDAHNDFDTIFTLLQESHDAPGSMASFRIHRLIAKYRADIDALTDGIGRDNKTISEVIQSNNEAKITLMGLSRQLEQDLRSIPPIVVWLEETALSVHIEDGIAKIQVSNLGPFM